MQELFYEGLFYMGYIYKIVNLVNNKVYIGQTTRTLEERYKEHLNHAKSNDRDGLLYKAMNKYGLENFKISMLEEVDNNKLNEREIYYIALYKATQKRFGYNMTEGGNGISSLPPEVEKLRADKISKALSGRKQPADLIEKRTAKLRGRKRTPEQRMRISLAHEGKSHKGTPCSEEKKEKLRKANLGKKQSEETKQKRRLALSKLKWFTDGQTNLRAVSCPEGFYPGITLKRKEPVLNNLEDEND